MDWTGVERNQKFQQLKERSCTYAMNEVLNLLVNPLPVGKKQTISAIIEELCYNHETWVELARIIRKSENKDILDYLSREDYNELEFWCTELEVSMKEVAVEIVRIAKGYSCKW